MAIVRSAVLIGVARTGGGLAELPAVGRSISQMRAWLGRQGLTDDRITTVADVGGPEGSKVSTDRVYEAVQAQLARRDVEQLLVYFCGHGRYVDYGEQWYLSDAPDNPNALVNVARTVQLAGSIGVPHVVIVSDACRNAPGEISDAHGSVLFADRRRHGVTGKVDIFYGCALGTFGHHVSRAGQDPIAIFTETLLGALDGTVPEVLEADEAGWSVVRPRTLEEYLPRLAARYLKGQSLLGSVSQTPAAVVTSGRHAWMSRVAAGPVAPAPGPPIEPSGPTGPPIPLPPSSGSPAPYRGTDSGSAPDGSGRRPDRGGPSRWFRPFRNGPAGRPAPTWPDATGGGRLPELDPSALKRIIERLRAGADRGNGATTLPGRPTKVPAPATVEPLPPAAPDPHRERMVALLRTRVDRSPSAHPAEIEVLELVVTRSDDRRTGSEDGRFVVADPGPGGSVTTLELAGVAQLDVPVLRGFRTSVVCDPQDITVVDVRFTPLGGAVREEWERARDRLTALHSRLALWAVTGGTPRDLPDPENLEKHRLFLDPAAAVLLAHAWSVLGEERGLQLLAALPRLPRLFDVHLLAGGPTQDCLPVDRPLLSRAFPLLEPHDVAPTTTTRLRSPWTLYTAGAAPHSRRKVKQMRDLVLVHGRAQQLKDPEALKQSWVEALQEGLRRAGRPTEIPDGTVHLPYYGDTLAFFPDDADDPTLEVVVAGDEAAGDATDQAWLGSVVEQLVEELGITTAEIAAAANGVDPVEIVRAGPLNWPWVLAALRAVDARGFAGGATVALFTKDVHQYLKNPGIQALILDGVRSAFRPGVETVVVAHSLGSVVAYQDLVRVDAEPSVPSLITVGSPLGVRAIADRLLPHRRPPGLLEWFNAYDRADTVALRPLRPPHFAAGGLEIVNHDQVHNDTPNRHGISGYLSDPVVAGRILDALTR